MELSKQYEPAEKRMMELGMDLVTIKKEISFAIQHMNKNPKLMECSPESKLASVVNIANIGLTLNPASKEAYLLPRWSNVTRSNECCLEPSYVGLVKLLTDAGSVKSVVCNLVYENDIFEMDMADNKKPITHKPCLVKSKRGDILGAYAIATLPDDNRQVEWMDQEELFQIRERSETYKAYLNGKVKSCTWVTDEGEMMRKTVIKRIYKYLPRTDRMSYIDNAIQVDNDDYVASESQINYIESLLENSTYDEDQRKYISMQLNGLSSLRAGQIIEDLRLNQLDPVTHGHSYNQGDIAKHLNQLQ